MHYRRSLPATFALLVVLLPLLAGAAGAEEARLLRMPDIHGDQVVFVYGGDLYTVPARGGAASRLTSFEGVELYPKYSPDGRWIAFTGAYDGNNDVYVIPAEGGEPRRLTFHPGSDEVIEWSADGRAVLFRSGRESFSYRFDSMFQVSLEGGMPEMIPFPSMERITYSPDGTRIAFNRIQREFRTWKRYYGGMAEEIWILDTREKKSTKFTDWKGTDNFPMWIGDEIYFNSDREAGKLNLYAQDVNTNAVRKVTDFAEYDVKWPSMGETSIVFENGGYLYVVDTPRGTPRKIPVTLAPEARFARSRVENVAGLIGGASLSPSAKRVAFEARGEIFTVPAEHGDPRQLTTSPGAYDRTPAWSPDGNWVAWLSDATGEYEIYVRRQDGSEPARQVTKDRRSFIFSMAWSPDSKKIAFADKTWSLFIVDVASGKVTPVDKSLNEDIEQYAWSPDSRWLAYTLNDDNANGSIWLHSLESGKNTRITGALTPDGWPSFAPDGSALYFVSQRHYNPTFSSYDFEYALTDASGIFGVTLKADAAEPFPPRSDEEEGTPADPEDGKKDKGGKDEENGDDGDEDAPLVIDLEGIADRLFDVPVPPGDYAGLRVAQGKIFFVEEGGPFAEGGTLKFLDTEAREVKTVMDGVNFYQPTPDASKILYAAGGSWGIVDAAEGQSPGTGALATSGLETTVDPRAEWAEIFRDAWRLERDFFYDPDMHGVDWDAMYRRYEPLVAHVTHRWDLNYLIGEMIGELSTSHNYVGGGDDPEFRRVGTGLLGCDFEPDAGAGRHRFARLYLLSNWDDGPQAPLARPGIEIKEGDYLIAVNGREVTAVDNPFAFFVNTVGKQVTLKVNDRPTAEGARDLVVEPIGNDEPLRYEAWVEANRRKVSEATDGQVAYIHMPDTAMEGVKRFSRDFYSQRYKKGLVLDGRFNSGGFIPAYVIDRLNRPLLGLWSRREGNSFRTPGSYITGPMVCVTNSAAGSGGDAIPYFFRRAGLGKVVGTRTWGGLVGISRGIRLMDGGGVTMSDFGFWVPEAGWQVENHGVDPDYEVEYLPEHYADGTDPQLEKAIELVKEGLKSLPADPELPRYPVKNR